MKSKEKKRKLKHYWFSNGIGIKIEEKNSKQPALHAAKNFIRAKDSENNGSDNFGQLAAYFLTHWMIL